MSPHPLDRPVWQSLTTCHAGLAVGGPLAKRFRPDVNLFAATADESREAQTELARLIAPGEEVYFIEKGPINLPADFDVLQEARLVQMLADDGVKTPADISDITTLTEANEEEMLALATLTRPGPFLLHTHQMGHFRGVFQNGQLIAMAGERFKVPGFAEISAVCVHPDCRGQGLARRLTQVVGQGFCDQGEVPFLHTWDTNEAAIALYESLGFRLRTLMNVVIAQRRP
ncbi:MAG: GNAT family N-acetyltransferase [Alphaproteobacteria bacterium]|nr:MAG: GNAT family N-acetyltransferase [Alphaproteobacteria bacterium]